MDSSNNVMQVKRDIAHTTGTRGWVHVQTLAEESVKKMEREAIDEEDDAKGNNLRREAKAARKFLTDFIARINVARQVTDEPTDNDWLEVCM